MDKVIKLLESHGPLTGKDLIRETGINVFKAWRICSNTKQVLTRIVGRRYLRLDMKVDGYARLSPSIMREFMNYTIIGLEADKEAIESQAEELRKEIIAISKKKINLARETIDRLVQGHPDRDAIIDHSTFIIAGDVVFGMAHAELRPESSTGEMVRGSDLDIIVVTDGLSWHLTKSLDELIYREKYNLLINPVSKEEIDYIIKDLETVQDQLQFRDFKAMVASKILYEGEYLYGSLDLYHRIKKMLQDCGLDKKIASLEEKARHSRSAAEESLVSAPDSIDFNELMTLFYTTEEKEEIF